ncbi:exported hypothetical protein [uncultured delta proteobacterium]|uniref:DUF4136 domain-containing protein n=1 Tax=uncultured delta proteobacterium TaxID=34034 RepID=A0A212K4B2_9DELT|nr:exported hypothetical protein [uncultured delta proteobacterium]
MVPARYTVRLFFLFLALGLAAFGCAKPTATVDGLAAPGGGVPANLRYAILPGMADTRPDDLQFVEYKNHLIPVLRGLGLAVAEDGEQATATVLLSYHTSEMMTYSDGSGPTVGIGVGSGSGGYYDRDWGWGGGSFFGLGIGVPMGGGQTVSRYKHAVILDAVAGTPDPRNKGASLWKITVTADNGENNLRALMPAMLEAAKPYIGKDTHGAVTVPLEK